LLSQRVLLREGLQFGYEVAVTTELQVRINPAFQGGCAKFVEASGFGGQLRHSVDVGERMPTPQGEGRAEIACDGLWIRRLGRSSDHVLEVVGVDVVTLGSECVSRACGGDHIAELSPEVGYVGLHRFPGTGWRVFAIDTLHERIRGDGLSSTPYQEGEDGALLWPAW